MGITIALVEDPRLAVGIRAARVRRRWRQADLAAAAGVSRGTVSRVERGHLDELTLRALRRVAAAVDVRVELLPRSRGADFDRIANARHARLGEAVVRWLDQLSSWTVRPEVSFSSYGERGVIDLLAWHAERRCLLVIELKTDLIDIGELIATLGRKERLAAIAAAPFSWRPRTVACCLIVGDSTANRDRVRAFEATLRAAFPADGRRLRAWLREPDGHLRALLFFRNARPGSLRSEFATVRRVRRPIR